MEMPNDFFEIRLTDCSLQARVWRGNRAPDADSLTSPRTKPGRSEGPTFVRRVVIDSGPPPFTSYQIGRVVFSGSGRCQGWCCYQEIGR
jgi:hypothetical protein